MSSQNNVDFYNADLPSEGSDEGENPSQEVSD